MAILGTSFVDGLGLESATFHPSWGQEISGQASGQVRVKDLRPMLWRATLQTREFNHDDVSQVQADLMLMEGSLDTFYCYNPRRPYPQADPDGSLLGASTVLIHAIGGSNRTLRLSGLPIGYQITKGDFLSFDYGSPGSRALHIVNDTVAADGSGLTASFGVQPPIRPGASVGLEVELVQPSGEFRIVPGSDRINTQGFFSTVRFEAVQVL